MGWVKTEKTGSLNALSDVNILSPSTGEAIVYDQTSGKWINGTVSSVADLDDLTDVEITTPADGDSLIYDAANNKWVNGESSGSNDVVLTQDEYDALTPEEQNNGTNYFINNASAGVQSAAGTPYDNSLSDLLATDVQDAIDEVVMEVTNKVDKVNGKGLSTEDYTTAEKTKLASLSATVDVLGTLIAGQTSVTLSNVAITSSSTIEVFVDDAFYGVAPTAMSRSTGSLTLTFEAQSADMPVKVRVS